MPTMLEVNMADSSEVNMYINFRVFFREFSSFIREVLQIIFDHFSGVMYLHFFLDRILIKALRSKRAILASLK